MSTKSKDRGEIEAYLERRAGPFTVAAMAEKLGLDELVVRKRMPHLLSAGTVVNVSPGQRPAVYQHVKHIPRKESAPPRSVTMPNGSATYWQQYVKQLNQHPRAI